MKETAKKSIPVTKKELKKPEKKNPVKKPAAKTK